MIRYSPSAGINTEPLIDSVQNIFATSVQTFNGVITVKFARNLTSTDKRQDVDLDMDRYFIWAVGTVSDISRRNIQQHTQARRGYSNYTISFPNATECPGTSNVQYYIISNFV